ncbi:H/ACA ribonucleoprotein complex non-core subunit, partial [Lachnellula willkommii]
ITVDQPTTGSGIAQKSGEDGQQPNHEPATTNEESREWETDSSPIESSSDDSSDDSSDESEDGDNAYKLLSPEEQARILMEGDGGSDDEGNKAKGAGAQLRTKNEIPEVVIPKPDVTITEEMTITELGAVEAIVENILLVKAKVSGEYRVLESASVLCLADRSVIGVVSETLGRVQQPLYSVLFTNAGEIAEAKLEIGTKVFYSEQHSTYVFTQALKAYKGSDASNLHDEEVGDEEMEFSDDEAEMEHKRRVKQTKRGRGGKSQQNGGSSRGGHPLQQQQTPYEASKGLDYDDADSDGPYKPLSRPVGYAGSVGRTEAPEEGAYQEAEEEVTEEGDVEIEDVEIGDVEIGDVEIGDVEIEGEAEGGITTDGETAVATHFLHKVAQIIHNSPRILAQVKTSRLNFNHKEEAFLYPHNLLRASLLPDIIM